jgi:High-temperature-induced dauer-formation protein
MSLYPTFLRTLANVSPHLKSLSTSSSSKLISLFNSITSSSFLLAKESNPVLLHILLETITNIIEHEGSQNPILLYAIIRNQAKFQNLQRFDLQKAIAEVEEKKKIKEDKQEQKSNETPTTPSIEITSPITPVTAFSIGDEDDPEEEEIIAETRPLSEKARGKLPEGVEIPKRESSFSASGGLLTPTTERRDFHPSEAWVSLYFTKIDVGCNLVSLSSVDDDNASYQSTRTPNFLHRVCHANSLDKTDPRTPPYDRITKSNCIPHRNRIIHMDTPSCSMVQSVPLGSNFLFGNGYSIWCGGSLERYSSTVIQSSTG